MPIGFDNLPLNTNLVVGIPMFEGVGTLAHDQAKPHFTMTLTGAPAWAQLVAPLAEMTVLDFNEATPDFMEASAIATGNLDFMGQSFSMAAWVRVDDFSNDHYLWERGLLNTDGYYWYIDQNGALMFVTNQGTPANQVTYSVAGHIALDTWYLVGMSRNAGSVRLYKNGLDITDGAAATHTDPSTATRKLHFGVDTAEGVANAFAGRAKYPRIWERELISPEHWAMFEMERWAFQV